MIFARSLGIQKKITRKRNLFLRFLWYFFFLIVRALILFIIDTYIEMCPSVTPVFGLMYRGFVRDWATDALIEAHKPFIKAIRSIALSPFAILLVASLLLVLVYLIAFAVEWILLRVNLYRENPYAKVPLVHAKDSEFYNPSMHDIDEHTGHDRKNKDVYFGNSSGLITGASTLSSGDIFGGGGGIGGFDSRGVSANSGIGGSSGNVHGSGHSHGHIHVPSKGRKHIHKVKSTSAIEHNMDLELEQLGSKAKDKNKNKNKNSKRSKMKSPKLRSPNRQKSHDKDKNRDTDKRVQQPLKPRMKLNQSSYSSRDVGHK